MGTPKTGGCFYCDTAQLELEKGLNYKSKERNSNRILHKSPLRRERRRVGYRKGWFYKKGIQVLLYIKCAFIPYPPT